MLPLRRFAIILLIFVVTIVLLTTLLVFHKAKQFRKIEHEEIYSGVSVEAVPTDQTPTEVHLNAIVQGIRKRIPTKHENSPKQDEQEGIASVISYDDIPYTFEGYFDIPLDSVQVPNKNVDALNPKCKTTVGVNMFVTDSRGYTCLTEDVDASTNCCTQQSSTRFSCKTCDARFGCCTSYEYCVSCCMSPDKATSLMNDFNERQSDRLYQSVKTKYQYCTTRCRTTSKSVINQNRYKSPLKHCYSTKDPVDLETIPQTISP
ncbi:hypothetical protein AKO1_008106 [Acrasis kona]|uniref:SREBP regulating gene protein n=1 Tax=Acrasis kona TaxID=1008807 RepID=A0AAW2YQC6_9EUKA